MPLPYYYPLSQVSPLLQLVRAITYMETVAVKRGLPTLLFSLDPSVDT